MSAKRIEQVRITRHEATAGAPWEAGLWVDYFVEEALARGFAEAALPSDAIGFRALWHYIGEVRNGGHEQYFANRDGELTDLPAIAALLARVDLPRHAALVEAFARFAAENDERLLDLYLSDRGDEAPALFYPLDAAFAAAEQEEGPRDERLRAWLLAQPWLKVDDEAGPASIDWLRRVVPERAAG